MSPWSASTARSSPHCTRRLNLQPTTCNLQPETGLFTTLRSGLGTLVDRLVAGIPQHWLRSNATVTAIRYSGATTGQTGQPGQPAWTVVTRAGKQDLPETFDAVFLATPLDVARQLLAPLSGEAAQLLPTGSNSAVLVAFCYADAGRVPLPPGFGFLVPPRFPPQRAETARRGPRFSEPEHALDPSASLLLACTFADQKFAHRVPPNGRLVRAFFGGAAADRIARCGNDEIAAIARLELARVLNAGTPISAPAPMPAPPPVLTVVRRWPNSLPQYAVGHPDRVAELEAHLRGALPGLTLLGNALHGVGLPDLIRAARAAARSQLATNN